MQSIARPFVGIVLFVGALSPFVLSHRSVAPPVFSTTSIRETHGESLTAVKVTVATAVQDVRPLALQRGINLDGRMCWVGGNYCRDEGAEQARAIGLQDRQEPVRSGRWRESDMQVSDRVAGLLLLDPKI